MSRPLAERADRLRTQLAQFLEEQEDADAWNRIRTASAHAKQGREALQSAIAALARLETAGVSRPSLPRARVESIGKSRRNLRATATNITGVETREMAKKVSTASVHDALRTAEDTARSLVTEMNRAVDKKRLELLPENITDRVIRYPGVQYSVIVGLERRQQLLQTPVSGVAASDLPKKIEDIREAVDYWKANRPLLDQAQRSQHADVKRFLDAAASEEGASWALITDVVRNWIASDENAESLRIHLR
jgi:hypothetical protein